MSDVIKKIEEKVKEYSKPGKSHEFSHTWRVLRNSIKIARKEKDVDMEVVKIAALLHDIMREKEDKKEIECHAEEGAKEAEKILREMNFPEDKLEKVLDSIKNHRLSKNLKPKTKEGLILQDADRLDSLGALLIARSFSSAHTYNRPFHDSNEEKESVIKFIKERAAKLTPESFNTQEGRKIAKQRYNFQKNLLNNL